MTFSTHLALNILYKFDRQFIEYPTVENPKAWKNQNILKKGCKFNKHSRIFISKSVKGKSGPFLKTHQNCLLYVAIIFTMRGKSRKYMSSAPVPGPAQWHARVVRKIMMIKQKHYLKVWIENEKYILQYWQISIIWKQMVREIDLAYCKNWFQSCYFMNSFIYFT